MESAQSTVLDWRRIDFWRNSSFAADWAAFKRREMKMPTDPAVINSLSEDKCAPFAFCYRLLANLCASMLTCGAQYCICESHKHRVTLSSGCWNAFKPFEGCLTGRRQYWTPEQGGLCPQLGRRRPQSCCRRARCCWLGKPAYAATQGAPAGSNTPFPCAASLCYSLLLLVVAGPLLCGLQSMSRCSKAGQIANACGVVAPQVHRDEWPP